MAVSGGVDSLVLLYLLCKRPGLELIVAHFNHGIRPDSAKDEQLVKGAAKKYGLPVEVGYGYLGTGASEEAARKARYGFLKIAKEKHSADAIITAHHQDDLIETAFINIIRGTGPRGLTAILHSDIKRPLLPFRKTEIIDYARAQGIKWREDSSNQDLSYLRNYVRQAIMPKLSDKGRREILKNVYKIAGLKKTHDGLIATISQDIVKDSKLNRQRFIALPMEVAQELLTFWLKKAGIEVDRKLVERLAIAIKTAMPNTAHDVKGKTRLLVKERYATLITY